MEVKETTDRALNIRPAIVVFFGEDAFACCEAYSDLLGRYVDVQRTLNLSDRADGVEWGELLEGAFQLFTAVAMKRLVDSRLIADTTVQSVPVYIVVRSATEKFGALIETIVFRAQEQGLAEKLQFVTVTDVSRAKDLGDKAAKLHSPVDSSVVPHVTLQNTLVAISDYWQGVRIGSNDQMQLASGPHRRNILA